MVDGRMLQRRHLGNCLLKESGCSCRGRSQLGLSRQLLSTATRTLQNRPDMRSFSCLTNRACDGALLFRVGEIFCCHSGGSLQSLVRDTVKIPRRMQCALPACLSSSGFVASDVAHHEQEKSLRTDARVLIVCLSLAAPIKHLLNVQHRVNVCGYAGLMAAAFFQHCCQLV
jgi:hypothetical protein